MSTYISLYILYNAYLIMPQTKPIVSIENVVASATINQTVNLNQITQIFPDVEYHPDQFPVLFLDLNLQKLLL